jgi:hypothetical protein
VADSVTFSADFAPLYERSKWLRVYVGKMVLRCINTTTLALQKHIKQDLFQSFAITGPKNVGVLNSRSGALKRSITVIPAQLDGDFANGGVGIGTKYGRVLFGKAGQVTTITPKSSQYLTIPLPAALNSTGTARGTARDSGVFGETFIKKSKNGNLIIFGKLNYTKGKKVGQAKSDILPLFVLKKSVDVPVRITTESIREWITPVLGKGLADIREGIFNSTVME